MLALAITLTFVSALLFVLTGYGEFLIAMCSAGLAWAILA